MTVKLINKELKYNIKKGQDLKVGNNKMRNCKEIIDDLLYVVEMYRNDSVNVKVDSKGIKVIEETLGKLISSKGKGRDNTIIKSFISKITGESFESYSDSEICEKYSEVYSKFLI